MVEKYSVGRRFLLVLYVIGLSLLPGAVGLASPGTPEVRTLVHAHPKLDTHLLRTAGLLPATAASRASEVLARSVAANAAGQTRVVLELAAPVTPAQEAELASHGFALAAANPARLRVQGWIDAYRIPELEALDFVLAIQSPPPVLVRIGRVTTEGKAILLADTLQARGITGSGVKVGVISIGDLGASTAQASGDLPTSITEISSGAASCGNSPDCGEGTAMMEIVHDLAPSASLAFCAPDSLVTMQTCVQQLVTSFHADIIVDDLGFVDEAQFEDSGLSSQISSFASAGLLYVSSAGNSHGCYYEADYHAGSTAPGAPFSGFGSYGSFHDFGQAAGGASSVDNTVVLPPYNSAMGVGELTVFLQWNTPYGRPTDDYDMFLTDNSNAVLDFSANTQSGQPGQHPFEAVGYRNPSSSTSLPVHIRIARKAGTSSNNHLKLYILDHSSGCASLGQGLASSAIQFTTPDQGDVSGHAAAQAVIAVGAIDANSTDSSNYTVAEPFSSHGPVRIDFPALAMRSKPDIAAVDDVSVTGAGGFAFNGNCTTRTSCFYGTSAAAPHIAGLLALLKSGYTGDYRAALLGTARAAGPSASTGAGLANELAATTALSARPLPPAAVSAPAAGSSGHSGGGATDGVLLALLAGLSCWRSRRGRRCA